MANQYTYDTREQSGIGGEMTLSREEVRVIKKLCEKQIHENERDDDVDHAADVFPLGGDNWADLMKLRRKSKQWLVDNQRR